MRGCSGRVSSTAVKSILSDLFALLRRIWRVYILPRNPRGVSAANDPFPNSAALNPRPEREPLRLVPSDVLSRYLNSKNYFARTTRRIKKNAFLPPDEHLTL